MANICDRAASLANIKDTIDRVAMTGSSPLPSHIVDACALFTTMQRRGRHRRSDAAIDAAIFSMLLSGKQLTPVALHRQLLQNPRYNLSEHAVRRRLNEFFEFQQSHAANKASDDNADTSNLDSVEAPLVSDFNAKTFQDSTTSETTESNNLTTTLQKTEPLSNDEHLSEKMPNSQSSHENPVTSLQQLFANNESDAHAAETTITDSANDMDRSSPQSPPANDGRYCDNTTSVCNEEVHVKVENHHNDSDFSSALYPPTSNNTHVMLNSSQSDERHKMNVNNETTECSSYPHGNRTESIFESSLDSLQSHSSDSNIHNNNSNNNTDGMNTDSNMYDSSQFCTTTTTTTTSSSISNREENQAELLVNDSRNEGDEELREQLEREFAHLSSKALREYMDEIEEAVRQHRRQMAAKAASLISELPPSMRQQLVQKLINHSKRALSSNSSSSSSSSS